MTDVTKCYNVEIVHNFVHLKKATTMATPSKGGKVDRIATRKGRVPGIAVAADKRTRVKNNYTDASPFAHPQQREAVEAQDKQKGEETDTKNSG